MKHTHTEEDMYLEKSKKIPFKRKLPALRAFLKEGVKKKMNTDKERTVFLMKFLTLSQWVFSNAPPGPHSLSITGKEAEILRHNLKSEQAKDLSDKVLSFFYRRFEKTLHFSEVRYDH